MVLPFVIKKAVSELEDSIVPHDTVIDELKTIAASQHIESEDMAIAMATYILGFCSYKGFINDSSRTLFYKYSFDN